MNPMTTMEPKPKPERKPTGLAKRIFEMRQQGYSEAQVARKLRLPVGVIRREIADL